MQNRKIPIRQVVIVEGRYDKIALSNVIDAQIVTTEGFSIFHNREKQALLRRLGAERGLIVLTDSDGGGTQIRAHLRGLLPPEQVTHLYIPRIEGKERRKRAPSRSGVLGVEGMEREVLARLFAPFDAGNAAPPRGEEVTRLDLYEAGLLGGTGAKEKRAALCRRLDLPPLSSGALLGAVNILFDRAGFLALIEQTPTPPGGEDGSTEG